MRSKMLPAWALILLSPLLASACGDSRPASVSSFPPSVDMRAAVKGKPVPGVEIVTDPVARENYNAAIEVWGEAIWRAAGRICRHAVENGADFDFCPAADADPTEGPQ